MKKILYLLLLPLFLSCTAQVSYESKLKEAKENAKKLATMVCDLNILVIHGGKKNKILDMWKQINILKNETDKKYRTGEYDSQNIKATEQIIKQTMKECGIDEQGYEIMMHKINNL